MLRLSAVGCRPLASCPPLLVILFGVEGSSLAMSRQFATLVVAALLLGSEILGCELGEARYGCKIQGASCTCGFGCKSEYRYLTNRECRNAREREKNVCNRMPCRNSGICIQISQNPGFRCGCEGTGYYGLQCERRCPMGGSGNIIPYECVVI